MQKRSKFMESGLIFEKNPHGKQTKENTCQNVNQCKTPFIGCQHFPGFKPKCGKGAKAPANSHYQ